MQFGLAVQFAPALFGGHDIQLVCVQFHARRDALAQHAFNVVPRDLCLFEPICCQPRLERQLVAFEWLQTVLVFLQSDLSIRQPPSGSVLTTPISDLHDLPLEFRRGEF